MERLVIYGKGRAGMYAYEQISNSNRRSVIGFIDNYVADSTDEGDSLPTWTEREFIDSGKELNEQATILIAMRNEAVVSQRAAALLAADIRDVRLLRFCAIEGSLPLFSERGEWQDAWVPHVKDVKPVLPYLEYQVADECNLKCRACMHFSNLINEPCHSELGEFVHMLSALKKKFSSIQKIRLMGGEPLLNPELPLFIRKAREAFPLADIRVVTNGLLIPRVHQPLLDAMRLAGASFDISQYPPTRKIADKIVAFLTEQQIQFCLSSPIKKFQIRTSSGGSNAGEVFEKSCLSKTCTFLRGNRLYICPHIPMLYEMKEYFGFQISEAELEQNSFDVEDDNMDGWKILGRLQDPFTLCRYCALDCIDIPWSAGVPQKSDWFVDGKDES